MELLLATLTAYISVLHHCTGMDRSGYSVTFALATTSQNIAVDTDCNPDLFCRVAGQCFRWLLFAIDSARLRPDDRHILSLFHLPEPSLVGGPGRGMEFPRRGDIQPKG